jgi:hypothetical protein
MTIRVEICVDESCFYDADNDLQKMNFFNYYTVQMNTVLY